MRRRSVRFWWMKRASRRREFINCRRRNRSREKCRRSRSTWTQESVNVEYPGRDAVMVRKQFVKGMNYFDERYGEFWADADLAMQIRRGLKKIRMYPAIKAVRHADTSPAGDEGARWRRIGRAARRHLLANTTALWPV